MGWLGNFFAWAQTPEFQAIAATAGIVSAFWGAVFFVYRILSSHRRGIFYSAFRKKVFSSGPLMGMAPKLLVGSTVVDALYWDIVLFVNRSDETITESDFVELPGLPLGPEAEVLKTNVFLGDCLVGARLDVEDARISVADFIIRRNEGVLFAFLHNGVGVGEFAGTPKVQPRIYRITAGSYSRSIVRFLILLFSILVLVFSRQVNSGFEFVASQLDHLHESLKAFLTILALLFSVTAFAILMHWLHYVSSRVVGDFAEQEFVAQLRRLSQER